MKTLYALFAVANLTLLAPTTHAAAPGTDDRTETARKATAHEKTAATATAAKTASAVKKSSAHRLRRSKSNFNRSVLVLLGLEDSKAVTSPAKRDRQLHIHQKHLRAKSKTEARARRRRTSHLFS